MGLKRMAYRLGCTLVAWVGGGLVLGLGPGHAVDFSALSPDGQPSAFLPLPTPTREADSFEARLGVFAHSVGATEAGGVDAPMSNFCCRDALETHPHVADDRLGGRASCVIFEVQSAAPARPWALNWLRAIRRGQAVQAQ